MEADKKKTVFKMLNAVKQDTSTGLLLVIWPVIQWSEGCDEQFHYLTHLTDHFTIETFTILPCGF